jgi:pectinesterase
MGSLLSQVSKSRHRTLWILLLEKRRQLMRRNAELLFLRLADGFWRALVVLHSATRLSLVVALIMFLSAGTGVAQDAAVVVSPANRAVDINPDTHLVVTFLSAPAIGKSGQVRIYDAEKHQLVDTLDMSIPAGPDPARRVTPPAGSGIPLPDSIPTSPTTTTPAVRETPADLRSYQLNTVGGLENFHFYPVIVHGNIATIYPHNHVLRYGHRYIVQIDGGVLNTTDGALAGFTTDEAWTFRTKKAGPPADAARVVVAADGSGDFNTVQGAVDFVPDRPAHRVTVFIKNGTYEEIVFFENKSNLTIRGEDRDKVQVGYANNSAFNPPQPGPNRRCAFSVYDSTDIQLENFSVSNFAYGQAEGLLVSGSRNVVSWMNIKGSGDAVNLRGSVYLTECRIVGDGDTILGVGPAFFDHCEIQSIGPFMWIRNTDANHGNVFVNCTLIARERTANPNRTPQTRSLSMPVFARLPNNHGLNYPYAEAVLIRCRLQGIAPSGWGPIEAETGHLHLWEFDSTDLDGQPADATQRHPASKQLTLPQDAETIASYSKPEFILGGWMPVVEK